MSACLYIRDCIQETVESYEIKYGEKKERGVHKAKMIAACGGHDGFKLACDRGDVWSNTDDAGKEWWYDTEVSAVHQKGVKTQTKACDSKKTLTRAELTELNDICESLNWSCPKTAQDGMCKPFTLVHVHTTT